MYYVLQIEDSAVQYFESVVGDDNITVNYDISKQPQYLAEYIEGWRRQIWDLGFPNYFKGHNYFKKGDSFQAHEGSKATVRKVIYRYFQRHLQCYESQEQP